MSVRKKYMEGLVSGAALRDGKGKNIDETYVKKNNIAENNVLIADGNGEIKDSGVPLERTLNVIHGSITFVGADTEGTLGDDFAGFTKEQLMKVYPFNEMKIKEVDAYKSDKTTVVGKDRFLEMPNFYKKTTCDVDGSLKIEVSNIKWDESFERVFNDEATTKLNLGVYKAARLDGLMHSVSGELPVVSTNQTTALGQMPFYKKFNGDFRRAEYQDYRIRGAYTLLATIYLKNRNSQATYQGIVAYQWGSGNLVTETIEQDIQSKSGACDSLGLGVVSGEITSYLNEEGATVELENGKRPFKLLGVENPYGLVWENVYGLYHKDGNVYAYRGLEPLTESDINPSDSNTKLTEVGIQMPTSESGWAKGYQDISGYMCPISLGGNNNLSYGDHYGYNPGWRICFVGGGWGDTGFAGLVCSGFNFGFGDAFSHIGFRLSYSE